MKRGKRVLLTVFCLFLCLFVLREIGMLDINLYQSRLSNSHSSTKSKVSSGEDKNFSYHVVVKHRSKILHDYTHSYNNLSPVEIEAILDDPIYSGGYILPLFKNFRMKYLCTFTTTQATNGNKFEGKIKGEINGKIYGFCSRRKAKELAFALVEEQIESYFQEL